MNTTNILRLQLNQLPCHHYEALASMPLKEQDPYEIKHYVEELDNNLIYDHPFLYANNQINVNSLHVILSRGVTVEIAFNYVGEIHKGKALPQICLKLLTQLDFLNYPQGKAAFNPFEQKNAIIPGLSIEPVYGDSYVGIAILPVNLHLEPAVDISSAKVLLDYSKGIFYSRNQIVRVDKINHKISFRNGLTLEQNSLRKGKLKNVVGFPLADKLNNYMQRIKENSGIFMQNWGISLDSRFLAKPSRMIPLGNISFQKQIERPLNDLVFPVSRNTYNHYYRLIFKDVNFHEPMQTEILCFIASGLIKPGKAVFKQMERNAERMDLRVKMYRIQYETLNKRQDIMKKINQYCRNPEQLSLFMVPQQPTKTEQDSIDFIQEELIKRGWKFHFVQLQSPDQQDQADIMAIRHLAILEAKVRKNPWKLKQIPFGDKPTITCSLNIQEMLDDRLSVAIVSTMNCFFSKFSSYRVICTPDNLNAAIFQVIRQSLEKFQEHHKIIPFRIFVFRSGRSNSEQAEHNSMSKRLAQYNAQIRNKNSCTLTYIVLNKSHPFRTYTSTDDNYVSSQTVKKTQLLSSMEISGRTYVQLEFEEPPMEVMIYQKEKDPTFVPKVLELVAKLCYGSVGNSFGKGIGFLDFGKKLNDFRNMNISSWENLLRQGFLPFL